MPTWENLTGLSVERDAPMFRRMPDIDLEPGDYRPVGEAKPRLNWWQRLNAKPANWDEPEARASRWIMAIIMGLSLMWIRSRH
jgi:hypothetical protein